MMTHRTVFASLAAVVLCAVVGHTQNGPAPAADPRVGLTPGFRTAGESARNMQLVSTLPKPEGFFDPKAPAGQATPPEIRTGTEQRDARRLSRGRAGARAGPGRAHRARRAAQSEYADHLRQLGPRVQRRPAVRRQLPGIQYLRHRERRQAATARLGRLSGRSG